VGSHPKGAADPDLWLIQVRLNQQNRRRQGIPSERFFLNDSKSAEFCIGVFTTFNNPVFHRPFEDPARNLRWIRVGSIIKGLLNDTRNMIEFMGDFEP